MAAPLSEPRTSPSTNGAGAAVAVRPPACPAPTTCPAAAANGDPGTGRTFGDGRVVVVVVVPAERGKAGEMDGEGKDAAVGGDVVVWRLRAKNAAAENSCASAATGLVGWLVGWWWSSSGVSGGTTRNAWASGTGTSVRSRADTPPAPNVPAPPLSGCPAAPSWEPNGRATALTRGVVPASGVTPRLLGSDPLPCPCPWVGPNRIMDMGMPELPEVNELWLVGVPGATSGVGGADPDPRPDERPDV